MIILALDSSGQTASAAIVENEIVRAEYTTDYKKTHSETLLPMLDEITSRVGISKNEIAAVAVSAGPGSFTGLRIGSATAKGIAMALDIPVVEVPTLEVLAFSLWGNDAVVCPIMDARRDQVYNALFRFEGDQMVRLTKDRALGIDELAEELNGLQKRVVFCGDGIIPYREKLEELLQVEHLYAPAHLARQRAASCGVLGMRYFREGKAVPAAEHVPVYLRKSQAEREREKKMLLKGDRA